MSTGTKWLLVCVVLLLVGFLGILPRAFDYQWTFWSPEGSKATPVADEALAATATEKPAAAEAISTEPPATGEVVEMPLLDCGEFGSYQAIPIGDNWEYWMQEPDKVSGQYGLVELKLRGGECKLTVPDGYVAIWNQSAGSININGEKGSLGNPVKLNGSEFLTGDILSSWGAKNDSAGVMITLIPE